MNWNAGYVTEIEYTYGYYRELCPLTLRLACLSAGVAPPQSGTLRYLELGFGQGLSINIHAAANAGEFWGTDFNPTQASHARALSDASGSGARLLDDSFAELAARSDLPEFDIIGLHGIWTWISEENSKIVVDIIRRKLKIGGALYISYNCFPGWAPAVPLRHLMKLHGDLAGAEAPGMIAKLDGALAFAKQVVDSGALYFKTNPAVGERLKKVAEQNRNYLAHEYFTHDWRLTTFSGMAETLDAAKVSFVASAHLTDHVDIVNLSAEGQKLLSGISHPILRQSVRDYFVNQQFRRDIFVKGPRNYTPLERFEVLRSESFVLTTHAPDVPRKVTGSLGEATLQEPVYGPLIEALAENSYSVKKMKDLLVSPLLKSLQPPQVIQALLVLVGAGHVSPAQQPPSAARNHSRALNRYLTDRARISSDISYLASPATGGGVPVSRVQQLFLLALQQNKKSEAEQADFAWKVLSSQGHRLSKEGKPLASEQENRNELMAMAQQFVAKRLPILKALEVA